MYHFTKQIILIKLVQLNQSSQHAYIYANQFIQLLSLLLFYKLSLINYLFFQSIMDDNCFEILQQSIPQSYKIFHHESPKISIPNEANPILPIGKYTEEKNQLIRYRLELDNPIFTRQTNLPKLNRQIPSSIKERNKRYYSVLKNHCQYNEYRQQAYSQYSTLQFAQKSKGLSGQPKNDGPQQRNEKNQIVEYIQAENNNHEFSSLIEPDRLVFKRFNNDRLNYFCHSGKKYYSSVFFDVKQFLKKEKITDFYQHLSRKYFCNPTKFEENLKFQSNFESSNLFSVYKISEKEYDCFMQNDTNTKGSTQWFYFSVKNKKRIKIKFNIINFYKPSSLYEKGMKPVIYSTQRYKLSKQQWKRGGQSVSYQQIPISEDTSYYKLSFVYQFQFPDDTVYFAYSFPYTYSDLKKYLDKITDIDQYKKSLKKQVVCKSLLHKSIYLLEISQDIKLKKKKDIIYIIGRQHAGQTPGSYVMEGVINFLLSNRLQANELREKYIFKIIPMVNPDGVVLGNYRCNLSGFDVNRKWDFPSKSLHPQIIGIKNKIIEDKKQIKMFLDLHAHSRKMNSFFYGSILDKQQHKLYPFVCSKLNKDISYEECSYTNDPSKRSTARVVCQQDIGIKKCYTFQTSFYGRMKDGRRQHFQKLELKKLGGSLMLGIYFSEIRMGQESTSFKMMQNLKLSDLIETELTTPIQYNRQIKQIKIINITKEEITEKWIKEKKQHNHDENNNSVGSDSQPQQFQLKEIEIEQLKQLTAQQNEKLQKNINGSKDKNFMKTIKIQTELDNQKNNILKQVLQEVKKQKLNESVQLQKQLNKNIPVRQSQTSRSKMDRKNYFNKAFNSINYQAKTFKFNITQLKKSVRFLFNQKRQNQDKSQNNSIPRSYRYYNETFDDRYIPSIKSSIPHKIFELGKNLQFQQLALLPKRGP